MASSRSRSLLHDLGDFFLSQEQQVYHQGLQNSFSSVFCVIFFPRCAEIIIWHYLQDAEPSPAGRNQLKNAFCLLGNKVISKQNSVLLKSFLTGPISLCLPFYVHASIRTEPLPKSLALTTILLEWKKPDHYSAISAGTDWPTWKMLAKSLRLKM